MNNVIDNNIKRNLKYFEHVKKNIDAQQTKSALVTLRNEWLKKQKIKNYESEYNRLIGELNNSVIKGKSVDRIRNRAKQLEDIADKSLGKTSIEGKAMSFDQIYEKIKEN